jgi:hypothetical protein
VSAPVAGIAADKDTSLVLKVLLTNAMHGTLADRRISFTAKFGFVAATIQTDESGLAEIPYYVRASTLTGPILDTVVGSFKYESSAGERTVHDTVFIALLPGNGQSTGTTGSLELFTSRTQVQVKGTGNASQAVLTIRVLDIFRNPVQDGTPVTVRIASGPGGGEVLGDGVTSEIVATEAGEARVIFHGGTRIGVVEIQATSGSQSSRQALLTVVSGPPRQMSITAFPDPQRPAGDRWRLRVQALLTDAYLNPVKDSISVLFTLGYGNPAAASIQGAAFTGNKPCPDCDSTPGSAFTEITYQSDVIFDSIIIVGETGTDQGAVRGGLQVRVPLQNAQVRAEYSGGAVFAPSNFSNDTTVISGKVFDGFGYAVSGATLCFASDGGTVVEACRITDAEGEVDFGLIITARDQTSLEPTRLINVTLTEKSTGAAGATAFRAIFQ